MLLFDGGVRFKSRRSDPGGLTRPDYDEVASQEDLLAFTRRAQRLDTEVHCPTFTDPEYVRDGWGAWPALGTRRPSNRGVEAPGPTTGEQ